MAMPPRKVEAIALNIEDAPIPAKRFVTMSAIMILLQYFSSKRSPKPIQLMFPSLPQQLPQSEGLEMQSLGSR